MADLKVGSTVGGSVIWHQGNFPLNSAGDDVLYKSFKIYSEYNKPQAADNDFVSKSTGGTYTGPVTINYGVNSYLQLSNNETPIRIRSGGGTGNTLVVGGSSGGISFRPAGSEITTGQITITPEGLTTFTKAVKAPSVTVTSTPSAASDATRKDYVDGAINTVTANANSRVLRSGDTMTGNLTAPNLFSQNPASQPSHVPRFDQIVIKDSVQDFGYY
ncbi:tail fiber protein [Escherichia coli]|uniref:Hinge connector of long tail fiber distal connector n=1 Tax=Shigella phage CM8 TaxID=2591056 RepID=A0A5B9MX71_9CAUD|nr:tail fiber protein [Escherichia coli]YP_010076052.1 hinge connector of long tail fiber protein distal connector [Shigella phage CM8]QBO61256.1 putative tail fiber protein [Escherichia phage D5505]QNJ50073.1 tail connector protein [Yersinia phage PYps32T]QNJ50600.1 tail connector protein [Yersinia phage PYps47T]QEG04929.1 hinge connector of long tail fiber distal connector [Shigella phage CM8]